MRTDRNVTLAFVAAALFVSACASETGPASAENPASATSPSPSHAGAPDAKTTESDVAAPHGVQVWLTDGAHSLAPQTNIEFAGDAAAAADPTTIDIDDSKSYQTMDGFGAAMTDSAAYLISKKMSAEQRDALMTQLFDRERGAGFSFTRVPMGASDFHVGGGTTNFCSDASSAPYSYDDAPPGGSDPTMAHFSIAHDLAYIVPTLQQALSINPALKIVSTPWSPPAWMKTNKQMSNCGNGGGFNSAYYDALAKYFVKFVQAYAAKGIPIYALTPQNEPGQASNYPGMSWSGADEATFVGKHLGPALAAADLHPKLLGFDYNWGTSTFPSTLFSDKAAATFLSGTAFHCYGGPADGADGVHDAYPDKEIYETECSLPTKYFSGAADLIIRAARHWSKTALTWNIALDTSGGPKTGTGCKTCTGTVTIDQATGNVTYNAEYYQLAHASKFVLPGAQRIDSSPLPDDDGQPRNVAFRNPDGSTVLIVHNTASAELSFRVRSNANEAFSYSLAPSAIATFVWR